MYSFSCDRLSGPFNARACGKRAGLADNEPGVPHRDKNEAIVRSRIDAEKIFNQLCNLLRLLDVQHVTRIGDYAFAEIFKRQFTLLELFRAVL